MDFKMKLTLDEYSKHFNITKDVIYSKLRTKKLDYAVENGIVYIIDNSNTDLLDKQKTTIATIITLYKKENRQLKEKIVQLENKIDKLIADKEKMFKDEISKIETLHALKDKQLKNILELIEFLILFSSQTGINNYKSFPLLD
jgi:tRNA(Ile)-lysidine synthase TilS/MesJ